MSLLLFYVSNSQIIVLSCQLFMPCNFFSPWGNQRLCSHGQLRSIQEGIPASVVTVDSNYPGQERKLNNFCIFQNELMHLKDVVAFQKACLCSQPVLQFFAYLLLGTMMGAGWKHIHWCKKFPSSGCRCLPSFSQQLIKLNVNHINNMCLLLLFLQQLLLVKCTQCLQRPCLERALGKHSQAFRKYCLITSLLIRELLSHYLSLP